MPMLTGLALAAIKTLVEVAQRYEVHAKIGQPTLENDLFSGALTKADKLAAINSPDHQTYLISRSPSAPLISWRPRKE
jgi:hypothetical protein